MITVSLFLVVLGLVMLLLAGFNVSHPRVSFGWLGLFLLAAVNAPALSLGP